MLLSFSVQNYKSFAEGQTLSLVAGGLSKKSDVSFPTGNSMAPYALRSACLFGPNRAGKTTLIEALLFVKAFIENSSKDMQQGEPIDVEMFRLDPEFLDQPTEFEIIFIHNEMYYQYGFALDKERVWGEWLFEKPNAPKTRLRTIYQREYDEETDQYDWEFNKTYLRGEKEVWKNSTRDNALFLSTAVQLKAGDLLPVYDWFANELHIIGSPRQLSSRYTAELCSEAGMKDKILELFHAVDIPIKDILIDEKELDLSELGVPQKIQDEIKKEFGGKKIPDIQTFYEANDGTSVAFNFRDESDGTQIIFKLVGPFLEVLKKGHTLFVDELHNSLHPLLLKFFVGLFQSPEINKMNAQLVFTSHETSILSKGFMHKDQVWLVEKGRSQKTKLIPLSDFKTRDVSTFQKAYMDGRYGAVPIIGDII